MKTPASRSLVPFGVLCLVISGAFIALHVATPSDGARLQRDSTVFSSQGAVLSPYAPGSSLLQDGDILVAVDGISIEERARQFFVPVITRQNWKAGQSLEYTVIRDGKELKLEIPLGRLPLRIILADHWGLFLFTLLAQVLAAFVYSQKRSDPAARAFFIWAFSASHIYCWAFFIQPSDLVDGTGFWLFRLAGTGLWLIFWVAIVHLILIFPRTLLSPVTGRMVLTGLYASAFVLMGVFLSIYSLVSPDNLAWWSSWSIGEFLIGALYTIPAIILIFIQQLTAHSDAEKKKFRLVAYGSLISTVLGLSLHFVPMLLFNRSFITPNWLGLINFPFILGMAIAIWRYHLFDIDVIIRKTLVYGLVTGTLGLVYFVGVAVLQNFLTVDSGLQNGTGGEPPAVVIVATTLMTFALINPLRNRIQKSIDRRFYRQKYDTEKALAEFAVVTRTDVDMDKLTSTLISMVNETLQPDCIRLWLQPEKMEDKQ